MISPKSVILSILCVLFTCTAGAQNSANALLKEVNRKLNTAKDYSVEANIKVDIPFIRMQPADVKIYYKNNGKFKVESESIAVVPRQGFDQVNKMLADSNSYTSILQGDEMTGSILTKVVNILPLSDTSEVIFARFWIDPLRSLILKTQLTTRSSGTIVTEYIYGSQVAFGLPDQMTFSVDAKKFKLPKNFNTQNSSPPKETENEKEKTKGMILITFKNYQVNKGLPDSFFENK